MIFVYFYLKIQPFRSRDDDYHAGNTTIGSARWPSASLRWSGGRGRCVL